MSKRKLIKRLNWYYPLEKLHAYVTFPLIILYLVLNNPFQDILFLIYGLLVCTFILHQGQHYWKLKLYRLTDIHFEQKESLALFKNYRTTNRFLIFLMPIVLLSQHYFLKWTITSENLVWGILANAFSILEYINYYHVQLMMDNKSDLKYLFNNKKLKKASLAKDLKENQI